MDLKPRSTASPLPGRADLPGRTGPRTSRGQGTARAVRALALAAAVALVGGCGQKDTSGSFTQQFTGMGANDLAARRHEAGGSYGTQGGGAVARVQRYLADGRVDRTVTGSVGGNADGVPEGSVVAEGDGYVLNFESVEISALAKSILGDILAQNYTVDPRASGTVSLTSARAIPRNRLITVLETTLKAVNVAVVKEGGTYRLTPVSEAVGSGNFDVGNAGEGYGTSVIPVKYVSAQTVARVLESFASRPGSLKVDPATGYVLVQGTSAERKAVIDAASLVDADYMKDQSVGIFPLANSSPETIISELQRILDSGEGGLGQGQVVMQPMGRLNAVLVVSRRRDGIDMVGRWVKRLDRADQAASGVKVYRLKYGQAKNVAALLNDIYAGRGNGAAGSRDRDALEPSGGDSGGTTAHAPAAGSGMGGAGTAMAGAAPQSRIGSAFASFGSASNPASASSASDDGSDPSRGGSSSSYGGGGGGGSGGGRALMPNVRITPDVMNNSLLIYASAGEYRQIERTIRELDRPPVQVAIEATIAEVKLSDDLNYGVQFFLKNTDLGIKTPGSVSYSNQANLTRTFPGLNLLVGRASDPRFVLDALRSMTNVKILSSPSLVVIDNQPAVLQVGDQVPITTRSATSVENPTAPVVNNVEFRDTGIILRVLPRVNANGVVTLEVEQEISNVVDKTGGQTLTPTIAQRRIRSQIAVSSGQTVMLAGLITERQERGRSGIPGLVDIKFINEILSTNTNVAERKELIIFIKPQIMRDQVDAQSISEEFRARMVNMRQPMTLPR
ncbi:type II secretion system secretin GspD [Prosthecomicrobium sp. N25]|uniref:type II secretion system secretin GspD n=1 Tax=Prosthecomicrobium sp. N25 TaxID=3129254 RepID=UPI003077C702